ncbi:hypothetical protein [Halegenticoccus tardaugens]|uniref:hypothetical protein n=1 Tax=Halegenticoccus tardaugens TaxID=2071624 RepID=UPI00100B9BC1|nr:hypothetical protein [Halegenticoccus tardaugens]
MTSDGRPRAVLVRAAAPAPTPADCLVLSPNLVSTFDGDRWRHPIALTGADRRYRFDQTELERANRVLAREARRTAPAAIWLRERRWLLSSWSPDAVERLERSCRRAATEAGVAFVAWTGRGGDDGSTDAYDRVVSR